MVYEVTATRGWASSPFKVNSLRSLSQQALLAWEARFARLTLQSHCEHALVQQESTRPITTNGLVVLLAS